MIEAFIFYFGAIFGSFLNVCIARMPKDESIIRPASHCPQCKSAIAWYDNIPLVSYLLLGAKCRKCKVRISPRYFIVELGLALTWVYLWTQFGFGEKFWAGIVFFTLLLGVSMTDFETGLIPDQFNIFGIIAGIILSGIFPNLMNQSIWYKGILFSIIGLLAGGGALYLLAIIGDFLFKKESMGGGDIKLLAMMGAFLGWQNAIIAFFMAPFFALPFGLYLRIVKKSETFPFGPFIALGGAILFMYPELVFKYIFPEYGV